MLKKILYLTIAAVLTAPVFAGAATIQLPATNQTLCFNAGGGQQACTAPPVGQDGQFQAGVAWPAPRFTDNLNGTVKDNLTGLVWTKDGNAPDPNGVPNGACVNSVGDMSFAEAQTYIGCLNAFNGGLGYLGFNDWRLPNLNELESMVNANVADTAALYLNTSGFINVQSSTYWSATSDAQNAAFAWDVSLRNGDFPFSSEKNPVPFNRATQGRGVWPVRGASTPPAQIWKTDAGAASAGAAWPVPRFAVNAAATVVADKLTGLMWPTVTQTPGPANCPQTGLHLNWQNALDHVTCLNANSYLGFSDWRLPNRKELRSLIDYSQQSPALPAGHPFVADIGEPCWTSTSKAEVPAEAWIVSTADGSMNAFNKTAAILDVLPVRGPDVTAPALTMNAVASPTRLASVTVSGTVEAGTTPVVTVTAPATAGAVSVTGGTNWSCQISGMAEGVNTITVTAGDLVGNVATATAAITVNLPTGGFTAGAPVTIMDALKALRIAAGLVPAPAAGSADMLHADVAPLGAPDGRIDITDALLILKKAVGLVNF